jgi:hypothetical protein
MPGLFSTAIPPQGRDVQWIAREVIIDLFEQPHLMLRLTITGAHFPHRALEAYVTVGDVRSHFVRISPDGLRADAYFDVDTVPDGEIRMGHGHEVELIVPERFSTRRVQRLDRSRLSENTRLRYAGRR